MILDPFQAVVYGMGSAACIFRAGVGVLAEIGFIKNDRSTVWAKRVDIFADTGDTNEDTYNI